MDFVKYLISISSDNTVTIVKIIFFIFSLVFLGFIVFALFKTTWLRRLILWDMKEFFTVKPYGVSKMAGQWFKIKSRIDTGQESEFKLALIEGDDLMNEVLRRLGYAGETLGEKLEKITKASLSNIDDIKEAHKTRNNIVHDPDYRLTLEEARRNMEVYEKALSNLQAI